MRERSVNKSPHTHTHTHTDTGRWLVVRPRRRRRLPARHESHGGGVKNFESLAKTGSVSDFLRAELAVEPQQVVLGEAEAADWGL
jgi:hypothetical protein